MHYVYFLFAGYRVAIGRTSNLISRFGIYQRTHYEVHVLGVIRCKTKEHAKLVENDLLKRFQSCNVFRDMFYITPEMIDYITKNTTPFCSDMREEAREHLNSTMRSRYYKTEKYRKYKREYARKTSHKKKKSDDTLSIPFD